MVKAHELRVGNLLVMQYSEKHHEPTVNTVPEKIISVEPHHIELAHSDTSNLRTISLSDKWLSRMGFEPSANYNIFYRRLNHHNLLVADLNHNIVLATEADNKGSIGLTQVDYVHQLQNLYYDLTKQEIEIQQHEFSI